MYDNQIGRWHVIDQIPSHTPALSPYVYCADMPIAFVDPDGRKDSIVNGEHMDVKNLSDIVITGKLENISYNDA